MKTRIARRHRNRTIELLLDDGTKGDERKVLASMGLYEGTGAWTLCDIRLHPHQVPSAYSGSVSASDIHSTYRPESEEEAVVVRSLLKNFWEDEGGIHWAPFQGLVRGTERFGSIVLERINHVGFFTRAEGLAYLKTLQTWWAEYEGSFIAAKVPNPHLQITESGVFFSLSNLKREKRLAAEAGA